MPIQTIAQAATNGAAPAPEPPRRRSIFEPVPARTDQIIHVPPFLRRDMREWEANEFDAPANERFCGGGL